MSGSPRGSSFSRGFFSGLGAQAAVLLISFPTSVLLARLLGPDGKGALDVAVLIPTLVALFVNFGNATSYLVGTRRFPLGDIFASVAGLVLILAFFLLTGYIAIAWAGGLDMLAPGVPRSLLLLGALLIPLSLSRDHLAAILLGLQEFVAFNAVSVVYALANLAGIALFVWAARLDRVGALGAMLVAQIVCVASLAARLAQAWPGRLSLRGDILRETVSYGLRGQAGNILQFFNYRLDVLLMAHYRSLSEVGIYTLAVSLAEFLWYVPNASAMVIFPRTAAAREEAGSFTPLVFRVVSGITVLTGLVLALAGGPIIGWLYGPRFSDATSPFLVLLPGVVCLGAAKILSADLNGRGLPHYNALGALLSLVVTVALDLVLIPRIGATGAAWASSVAYASTLVYTMLVYARATGTRTAALTRIGAPDLRALQDVWARIRSRAA